MKFNTTGKANIIIKSHGNYSAAGKTFKKGQPITILKDASYNISFHSENREFRAGTKNLAGYANYAPYQISIEPVNITQSLAEILYKQKIIKETFKLPVNETIVSDDQGVIFLNKRNYTGNGILEDDVFIFDKNKNVISAKIDFAIGEISNLTPEEPYLISYYIEEEYEIGYKLGKTNIPYLIIEIENRDDFGTQGINTYINIPKAVLIIDPELNFDRDNITNISLVFNILDEDVEIIFHK